MAAGAAPYMGGSASAHSSSSISPPPPPWHPLVLVPSYHQQHQVLYDDGDVATPSPFPSPSTPATAASPPGHNHLRPAASRRRAGKPPQRRPRPSRKLPTTYISTDAASFRHMVHQVTGADDYAPLLPGHAASAPELLCRRALPSRGGLVTTTTTTQTETMLLPTLDTSAFLMRGAAAGGGACSGGAAPARPPGASCCHGSAVVVVDPGAPAVQVKAEEDCAWPWDEQGDDADLFLD